MAITIPTNEIYRAFYSDYNEGKSFMYSHTYGGNVLGCSVAISVLNILEEEKILEQVNEKSKYLKRRLHEGFADKAYVGEIRTLGLINAIELVEDKK